MIGYRFLSQAAEEMSEAAVFYEGASIGLGKDFIEDVSKAINQLRVHSEIGVRIDGDLRRVLLQRFPFSLIYAVEADEILIISVAHHRQRPGYWKFRTGR